MNLSDHYDAIVSGQGRQGTTAVSDGTISALAASKYLNDIKIKIL